jgi:prostaglandin-endoperoxide synthase 2
VIYAAISTIFIREHNRIAGELAKAFPAWDDHRLFHTARNINIVMLLCLVINEYINHLAQSPFRLSLERHFAERKSWYRANRIAIEFDLLYRWHSLTPNVLSVGGAEIPGNDYRFNNALLERHGVEALIAAASREPAGRIGVRNNPDFLAQAEWNAQAFARAQRVRSFTEYQVCFHDEVVKSFDDLAGGDKALAAALAKLYPGGVQDVELLVGLFAQHHDDDEVLPGLMQTMVAVDAFSQILTNPLLATNIYCEQAFSAVGEEIINSTKSFQQLVAERSPGDGRRGLRQLRPASGGKLGPPALGGDVVGAERGERAADDAFGVEAGPGVHDLGLVLVLEDVGQDEDADGSGLDKIAIKWLYFTYEPTQRCRCQEQSFRSHRARREG